MKNRNNNIRNMSSKSHPPTILSLIHICVDEVLTDGISCGRSHGCTHVHGIFDTIIHYFSGGNTADTCLLYTSHCNMAFV